jgi:hypothetical protein
MRKGVRCYPLLRYRRPVLLIVQNSRRNSFTEMKNFQPNTEDKRDFTHLLIGCLFVQVTNLVYQAACVVAGAWPDTPFPTMLPGNHRFFLYQCCGSTFFFSVQIQIRFQGAEPMRIWIRILVTKVKFLHEKHILYGGN